MTKDDRLAKALFDAMVFAAVNRVGLSKPCLPGLLAEKKRVLHRLSRAITTSLKSRRAK